MTAISYPTAEGATDRNPKIFERKWIWFGFQNSTHDERSHGADFLTGTAWSAVPKGSFHHERQVDQDFVISIYAAQEKGVTEVTP
ncbi:hypothetical protein N5W20_03885 [Candidatus Kirkpatrickella diaphorinae]|uniref:Uncharacterized protein n=1 Tax=Candidatus Kirkpatrickella diaphorinae TaxID=2984322 RepID=A0ABY6GKE1_9PROT|nr:hypothetical protein [Candidatus Kirkpatrickella diaphorinae]UYH52008.1 hypothetical protein N5W20_03885 [Candidatus Kirkpatrickella diaphorinae]